MFERTIWVEVCVFVDEGEIFTWSLDRVIGQDKKQQPNNKHRS